MRSKYKVGDIHDSSWTKVKSNWSSTWRSVGIGLREVIHMGQGWVLGDGRQIKFWKDRWLGKRPLMEMVTGDLPTGYEDLTARELWSVGVGWDLSKIVPFITENQRLELATVVVDSVTGAKDRLAWNENMDGKFTVKSAYKMLTVSDTPRQNMESFYKRVRKLAAPERVRVFLWLVGNQVLMTNTERYRRHLCDTDICEVCKGGAKIIIHILCDCPAMVGVWNRLVPERKRRSFFEKPLLEWIYENLCGEVAWEEGPWSTIFALTTWWAWKWRCGNVYGEKRLWRDRVKFLKDLAKEVSVAISVNCEAIRAAGRLERLIGWVVPPKGWYKLNTDGASHGNPGLATAGGVLHDERGDWCGGFAVNLGRCSAPLAELWGVYYGL